MTKKSIKVIYALIVLIILLTKECYAYLDPSAMTYVIQIGAAIGITLTTSIGIGIYKIRRAIKNKKLKKQNNKEIIE